VSGAVLRVRSRACFIGRRGRGAGWPDRGRGMAVTRSWSCSSGRDGRGGVGVVCRCWGDVGGALASQGDDGQDGEQCIWEWTGGDFLLFSSSGLVERGQGMGSRHRRV
jgi:hypothetical protein